MCHELLKGTLCTKVISRCTFYIWFHGRIILSDLCTGNNLYIEVLWFTKLCIQKQHVIVICQKHEISHSCPLCFRNLLLSVELRIPKPSKTKWPGALLEADVFSVIRSNWHINNHVSTLYRRYAYIGWMVKSQKSKKKMPLSQYWISQILKFIHWDWGILKIRRFLMIANDGKSTIETARPIRAAMRY